MFLKDGILQVMLISRSKRFFSSFLQNVGFTEESDDAMSFDECLQLLAETFPVEETEVRPSHTVVIPCSFHFQLSAV